MLTALQNLASRYPGRDAVVSERSRSTVEDLVHTAKSLVRLFRQAEHPLVVYIALPSGMEFTAIQFAAIDSGSIAVPIPPKSTTSEAARFFQILKPGILCIPSVHAGDSLVKAMPASCALLSLDAEDAVSSRAVISWQAVLHGNPVLSQPGPEKSALDARNIMVQFTSGSTGWPKAVLIEKSQLLASQQMSSQHLGRFSGRAVFCPVPQFHAMGNALVAEHLLSGSPIHLTNGLMYGEHLRRMADTKAIAIQASPNYFRMLLRIRAFSRENLPALEHFTLGSDWIDSALLAELRERFPNIWLHCRYGLSEAFGALAINSIPPHADLPAEGELGCFLPDVELEIPPLRNQEQADPVPLRLRSPTTSRFQLRETGWIEPLLDATGFISTGDSVRFESQGRIRLVGRESQFIKFNGFRISPFEIEGALRQVPGVLEAYVCGVPDSVCGQRIIACIVASPTASPSVNELRSHCLAQLSSNKVPERFLFDVNIPMTHSGKVARKQLSQEIEACLQMHAFS